MFARMRGWMRAATGRVIRRGFFRIVLLMFLTLFVLPFFALNLLANRSSANRIMDEVVVRVFDTSNAEVTWDEERTTFTGPSITLTGTITYYNLRIHRKTGATPHPARKPLEYDFITIPKVELLKAEAMVDGTGVLKLPIPFKALYDGSNAIISVAYKTSDATP